MSRIDHLTKGAKPLSYQHTPSRKDMWRAPHLEDSMQCCISSCCLQAHPIQIALSRTLAALPCKPRSVAQHHTIAGVNLSHVRSCAGLRLLQS